MNDLGALAEKTDRRWVNAVRAVSSLDELAICLPNYEQVLPNSSCELFSIVRVRIAIQID